MADNAISAGATEAEKLNALTGMDIPAEELSEQPEEKAETEQEAEPEDKPEEGKSEEEAEEEEEAEDEGEDEEKTRPAKKDKPIKNAFKQIRELRGSQKQIQEGMAKILDKLENLNPKQAEEAIDEIKTIAEKRDLDPEGLAEILELAEKRVLSKLEGKLNKGLDPEDRQVIEKAKRDQREREQEIIFTNEWNQILPELQKQFPNATAAELNQARSLMYDLARSSEGVILNKSGEVVANRELDYILYKNRTKFETVLKVAKPGKSGETSSKQIIEEGDEAIDLDPENMDPEKMKRYEKMKYK